MSTIAARQAALALARISSSRPSAQAGSLIHRRGLAGAAGNQFFYIYLPYTCSLCLHLTLLNTDLIYNVSIHFFFLCRIDLLQITIYHQRLIYGKIQ